MRLIYISIQFFYQPSKLYICGGSIEIDNKRRHGSICLHSRHVILIYIGTYL